jgi:hypothetical protein
LKHTLINKKINEDLRKLNIMVESRENNTKAMEARTSLLAQTLLGSFTKSHVDVVTTNESQIKNPKESQIKNPNEKRVETAIIPPIPPIKEVHIKACGSRGKIPI